MIVPLIAAAALAGAAPVPEPPRAPAASRVPAAGGGMVDLSLVRALSATKQTKLAGVFSFVEDRYSAPAFADVLARDHKALKLYLAELTADRKAAGGITPWDREVCATLLNLYAYPPSAGFNHPGSSRLAQVSDCASAPTVPLAEITARRKS